LLSKFVFKYSLNAIIFLCTSSMLSLYYSSSSQSFSYFIKFVYIPLRFYTYLLDKSRASFHGHKILFIIWIYPESCKKAKYCIYICVHWHMDTSGMHGVLWNSNHFDHIIVNDKHPLKYESQQYTSSQLQLFHNLNSTF
jgi:hypothetical protein